MEEKTFDAPVQERFEFVLSINGNIICQRYFAIPGFQERSIGSTHLTYAVLSCVNMIERDLREKTDIYNTLTAPQVFNDETGGLRSLHLSSMFRVSFFFATPRKYLFGTARR